MTTAVDKSSAITAALGAGTAETFTTTKDAAENYLIGLIEAGLWPTPLRPMTKAAYLHGWPSLPRPTAEDVHQWVDDAYTGPGEPFMGVGLRLGRGLIVADPDTPAEVAEFRAWCATVGLDPDAAPTVTTPGAVDEDGVQKHWGGGHWYIATPPGWLPPRGALGTLHVNGSGEVAREGAPVDGTPFSIMVTGCQVAAPPTVRKEGAYTVTGTVQQMTDELREWFSDVADAGRAAAAQRPKMDRDPDPAKVAWEDTHDWAEVLAPAGWTETGVDSECGCVQWHHPDASSPKSATAHECGRGTFLRMWSDSCDDLDQGSYSKLYALAALHHGGDYATACTAAGLPAMAPVNPALDLAGRMADITANGSLPAPAEDTIDYDHDAFPTGHPNDPELLAKIFDFDDITRAIFTQTRNHPVYVPPMAMLIRSMINAGRVAGPSARTAIADDPLNSFMVAVARSGGSKSAAQKLHLALPRRSGGFQENLAGNGSMGKHLPGVASGQAILDGLTEVRVITPEGDGGKPEKKRVMRDHPVLTIDIDEMKDLLIKCAQPGSIMEPTLLTGWSGNPVGDLSRGNGEGLTTGPYAFYITGAVQPSRAVGLVGADAVGSGLAQRLMLTCSEDPWATAPGDPEAWEMSPMDGTEFPPVPVDPKNPIKVPDAAWAISRAQYVTNARGTTPAEETHLFRMRVRLACLAALQRGTTEVTDDLWDWTGYLMEHRQRTWAFTVRAAQAAEQDAATDTETMRARARAGAAEAVGNDMAQAAVRVMEVLPPAGMTVGVLQGKAGRTARRVGINAVVAQLVRAHKVTTEQTARGGTKVIPVAG